MASEYYYFIRDLGFPIAVTVYLLWERGKNIKELTKAIMDLHILIKTKVK